MSASLKYILLSVMIIVLGVVIFLGYSYFTESQRPKSSFTSSPTIILSGQVLRGADTTVPGAICTDQYYLVGGNKAIWLTKIGADEVENSQVFSPYVYSEVEAKGSNTGGHCYTTAGRNCGCVDYLVVDNIKVLKSATFPDEETEFEGKIVCLTDINRVLLEGCVQGLQTEDGYLYYLNYLVGVDKSGITDDLAGAKVRVLGTGGVLGNTTIGANGAIDVFEISKIE